jgi:peptidoglycan/xylan/chitin deacetylase (PgdA/CDA1 family)
VGASKNYKYIFYLRTQIEQRMYPVKTPFWLSYFYPSLTWHESRTDKRIYLTFDDGPIPIVTPFVLKTLKKFEAKATFFCIGDNVRKHPEVFKQILSDGHAVGNHTFHHVNGWKTDSKTYLEEFKKCEQVVPSNLFRPPYGRITNAQIKQLRAYKPALKIIMWDILSHDYHPNLKPETCFKRVIKATDNGAIVVFHDSLKAQERLEYTLPKALEYWTKKGYRFCTW